MRKYEQFTYFNRYETDASFRCRLGMGAGGIDARTDTRPARRFGVGLAFVRLLALQTLYSNITIHIKPILHRLDSCVCLRPSWAG